jgi:hypothetical protein
VASERQIAANQSNARKSSGPRSRAGKRRARHNAYRHGLTSTITSNAAFAKEVEALARKIAGGTNDVSILECARAIAHAELDLARARRAKIALIERADAFGYLDPPQDNSTRELIRLVKAFEFDEVIPRAPSPCVTMPAQEPYRMAEAIRRVLPELLKLDRYERSACARRDRALRELIGKRVQCAQSRVADVQNEPNFSHLV